MVIPVLALALSIIAAFVWAGYKKEIQATHAFKQSEGEIVVIFEERLEEGALTALVKSLSVPVQIVRHIEDYALLRAENSEGFLKALKELESNPLVRAVQNNSEITAMRITRDSFSDAQWALNNTGTYYSYLRTGKFVTKSTTDVDMNIPEAWRYLKDQNLGQREVVIAIIDTGVDYQHPDLTDHIWVNAGEIPDDGLDNDNNGYIDDIYGWDFYNGDNTVAHYTYNEKQQAYISDPKDDDDHGTHIAGIIGATADNGIGIAGAASGVNVKLMILKINGGPDGTGSISSAVEAVKYATKMGADICNLSWGTYQYTATLKEVIAESDMLFVAAAGNSGDDNDVKPIYPANLGLPNLISVTYVDADGKLSELSNYGSKTVDIAAPGEDIYSTIVGRYGTMDGSSMAAPQVAAVAALLYSYDENIYPANVKQILLKHNKPLPEHEGKMIYPGIPDAYQAVLAASEELLKDTLPPVIELKTIYDKGILRVPVNVVDEGGSQLRVVRWQIGTKELADFSHGTEGTLVKDNVALLDRAGIYTFYASDFAGNEAIRVYEVKDDIKSPKITASYSVASNYKSRTVKVNVSDTQSNVKRVKYMAGSKAAEDFLPAGAGTEITLKEGKGSFKVEKDGTYSIYAIDHRGNTSVKKITVKTVKATQLNLSRSTKTLTVGDQFNLVAFIKPANTTDVITFTSSNKAIATVTKSGTIKALKAGTVTITAKTSSGKKATCKVTVK